MIGKITYISNNMAHIKPSGNVSSNLMNMHVIFEDKDKKILGEIEDISPDNIKVNFLGEIAGDYFIGGVVRKPTYESVVRMINPEELKIIIGEQGPGNFQIGTSALYDNYPINANINDFFSNHSAIFGNSGSGKSYGTARLLQNVFQNPHMQPYRANFLIFDTFGEYHNAFSKLSEINPNYQFKYYTTNSSDTSGETLKIPVYLLEQDDLALLLSVTDHSQLPIIEQMLKLVKIFASDSDMTLNYKNHIIAKAIMNILYSNESASSKKNDIFNIFNTCTTEQFNPEAIVQGAGYTRKFRELFLINDKGNFSESILLSEYTTSFINQELDNYEERNFNYYTLEDLEKALNFALISEGLLKNEKIYSGAIAIKVRLHSIIISENSRFFKMNDLLNKEQFISTLVSKNNRKAQVINFNLEDVEDWFVKFTTQFFVKLLFNYTKNSSARASIPFHIFLEEAHRYVQNDNDINLLGYNIFERVAKEGRKYGLILTLISQRPVELSDTVISQMGNFLIFKITHPLDVEYIRKMLPNISNEIVEKQKGLQPGTCMAFGRAFKIPMIVKMQLPDPVPESSNCDIITTWQS